ncbi:Calcium-dependent protein kinase 34 [Chlorella vulgaris]
MGRIDIWDVEAAKKQDAVDCGFPRDLETHFEWGKVLGKGGFGLVRVVVERRSGIEFACKSVSKTLDIPNLSPQKQAQHLDNTKREITILTRLRGTLSVVHFKGAYEDDASIHMVMELCRGGELVHEIGRRPYTEQTVAGYMRSVLHTLAQCHSHRILHRDIKPGNFMLLTGEEDSPLKAIDFGLAVFYEPDSLPRTDLGLEGTPWFMAPETLSSQTFPASDVWAGGVMAYQLLSGYLPFDDPRNPNAPALSVIWKGILTEQPAFRRSAWREVSEEAKDFVRCLLDKDHTRRPSAKDALRHPWLSPAFHQAKRRPLSSTVVQRIQRFAQNNVVRRSILELIAQASVAGFRELLKMMPALSPTIHGPGEHGGYLAAQHQHQHQHQHQMGGLPAAHGGSEGGSEEGHSSPLSPAAAEMQFPMSPDSAAEASGSFANMVRWQLRVVVVVVTVMVMLEVEMVVMVTSPRAPPSPGLPKRSASINVSELARTRLRTSLDGSALASSGGGGGGGGGLGASSMQEGDGLRGLLSRMATQRATGSMHGGQRFARSPSTQQLALLARGSERQRGTASVHGPGEYWRVLRQASELAAMESGHGKTDYLRAAPRTEEERSAQRKAARLSLDTSAHGGDEYKRLLRQLETIDYRHKTPFRASKSSGSLMTAGRQAAALEAAQRQQQQQDQRRQQQDQQQRQNQQQAVPVRPGGGAGGWPHLSPSAAAGGGTAAAPAAAPAAADSGAAAGEAAPAEERGRGRRAAKALLERLSAEPGGSNDGGMEDAPPAALQAAPQPQAAAEGRQAGLPAGVTLAGPFAGTAAQRPSKRVHFGGQEAAPVAEEDTSQPAAHSTQQQQQQQQGAQQQQGQTLAGFSAAAAAAAAAAGGPGNGSGVPAVPGAVTDPKDLEQLMRRMQFRSNKGLGPGEMSEGLRLLGYDLEPSEAAILMQQLDLNADGQVYAPEFVASQMDWGVLQESNRELWLECARRAFAGLDSDSDGRLSVESLIGTLRRKLPAAEVDYAVEDALVEAGYADADEVDFDGFLRMLKVGSYDSLDALDQYDARYAGSTHNLRGMDLEGSHHLDSVPEEQTPRGPPPTGTGF